MKKVSRVVCREPIGAVWAFRFQCRAAKHCDDFGLTSTAVNIISICDIIHIFISLYLSEESGE